MVWPPRPIGRSRGPLPEDSRNACMSRTTRTFVAIGVPEDRAAKLSRLQTLIAAEVVGVRWVDPKQFHATLAFLGDVDDTELNRVCGAVAEAAAGFGPFEVSLEG